MKRSSTAMREGAWQSEELLVLTIHLGMWSHRTSINLRLGAGYAGKGKHKPVVQHWSEVRSLECIDWIDPLFHMLALLLRKLSIGISYMQSCTSEPPINAFYQGGRYSFDQPCNGWPSVLPYASLGFLSAYVEHLILMTIVVKMDAIGMWIVIYFPKVKGFWGGNTGGR